MEFDKKAMLVEVAQVSRTKTDLVTRSNSFRDSEEDCFFGFYRVVVVLSVLVVIDNVLAIFHSLIRQQSSVKRFKLQQSNSHFIGQRVKRSSCPPIR